MGFCSNDFKGASSSTRVAIARDLYEHVSSNTQLGNASEAKLKEQHFASTKAKLRIDLEKAYGTKADLEEARDLYEKEKADEANLEIMNISAKKSLSREGLEKFLQQKHGKYFNPPQTGGLN